jgi:hypothetical protein
LERSKGEDADAKLVDAIFGPDDEPGEPEKGGSAPDGGGDDAGAEGADEGDDGDADDAELEEDDEPGDGDEETYEVKVEGQVHKVSLEELKKGYGLEASFTRKSQKLAEDRRTVDSEMQETRKQREEYAKALETVEAELEKLSGDEPDWDALLEKNPTDYVRQKRAWDKLQSKREIVRKERETVAQEATAEQKKQLSRYAEAQGVKLLEALPEWRDEKVAEKEQAELVAFLQSQEYSDTEINGIMDHRLVLMIRDAMKYRQRTARGKKVVADRKSTTLQPGGRETISGGEKRRARKATLRKRETLAKTGKADDAARVIYDLLDD